MPGKTLVVIKLSIILTLVMSLSLTGQNDIISNVRDAIKTGSSREISKLLDENVDMTLDGKMKSYSKAQAEFILRDFFRDNPPSSFTIVHQGASKSGLPYAIGEYVSNSNTYTVWVRVKKIKEIFVVHEISFIRE